MWRMKMRNKLIAAGMADGIVDNDRKWNYVLCHGDDELDSGWNLSWINKLQAKALLKILKSRFGNNNYYGLIIMLEIKIKT